MASLVVLHTKQPSPSTLRSSFSDFNGARLITSVQCKRKVWQPKGAFCVMASSSKKIRIVGGTQFLGAFLSRLLVNESHKVTLFTRGKERITQQLPGESDKDFADFSSQILDLKEERKDFDFMKSALSASKGFAVPRRQAMLILSSYILLHVDHNLKDVALAQNVFREYIDTFDGYSFKYPQNWIQVRGAGADIFFRDPFVLDENLSVEISSPSSSRYKSVEDLGPPEEAGKKVLMQYLTEFMSTRLGVRRESSILSTSSRMGDDGKLYYEVEVNIKSYANDNELAVMPQDRVARLEWDRRYLSVLGVENNRLYELRLQTPEKVFTEEEGDLREVMDSFRVNKVSV